MKLFSTLFFFLLSASLGYGQLTLSQIEAIEHSVVKIRSEFTPNKFGYATGFVYHSREHVVTALHAVSGAGAQVIIKYKTGEERSGKVIKVFRDADLALIRVEFPLNASPLTVSNNTPSFNQTLWAIGFFKDIPAHFTRKLGMRGQKTLENIIPTKNKLEIQNNGCPRINLSVYTLEDNPLLPGFSGCPIIDDQGRVVGIGDGGLEYGAASISWGIPSGHLTSLWNSVVLNSTSHIQSAAYFSADFDVALPADNEISDGSIIINQLIFKKVRSRTLDQLYSTSDDLLGFSQIMNTFHPVIRNSLPLFDIYQEINTGGTIVLPQGFSYSTDGDMIRIGSEDGQREMVINVRRVLPGNEMQYSTQAFELAVTDNGVGWMQDHNFTYTMPMYRQDGYMVRRKGFIKANNVTGYEKYLYETLAYKNGLLLMAANTNSNYNNGYGQHQQMCHMNNFSGTGCDVTQKELTEWGSMIVATHLTTFSISDH